jgi:hypothetical protein
MNEFVNVDVHEGSRDVNSHDLASFLGVDDSREEDCFG